MRKDFMLNFQKVTKNVFRWELLQNRQKESASVIRQV